MSTCPSRHCGASTVNNAHFCGKCGLDLHLDSDEIEARDDLLQVINTVLKKEGKNEIGMQVLGSIIKTHGARLIWSFTNTTMKYYNKTSKQPDFNVIKPKGLYGKFYNRLLELDTNAQGIVNNSDMYKHLCRLFSITKRECQELILILRDFGLVEIEKRGLRIIKNIS